MSHERQELLKQITILDFMAVDLQLFLNTNPTNVEALDIYNDCVGRSCAAKQIYEQHFGPLTGFRSENCGGWFWMDEPWPWQAEFNFSLGEA